MDDKVILSGDGETRTVVTIGTDIDAFEVHVIRDEPPGVWKEAYKKAWKRLLGLVEECKKHDHYAVFVKKAYELEKHMGEVFANGGVDDDS